MKFKHLLLALTLVSVVGYAEEAKSEELSSKAETVAQVAETNGEADKAAKSKKQKTILITGANRGLGLELSKQFAADGYYVIGTARSPEKATDLKEVAAEVLSLDVTSDESIQALIQSLNGKPVDILVHNAGYFGPTKGIGPTNEKASSLEGLTRDEVLDCFAVNAAGPLFVTQGLIPNLNAATGHNKTDMGGVKAKLSPEVSMKAVKTRIEEFTKKHNGRFIYYDGKELPW